MIHSIKIHNNCENCAFCAKHYINIDGVFRRALNCSHCINTAMSSIERKSRMRNAVKCEYWQEEQKQINERREHIEYKLKIIAKQVDEIRQILEDELNTKEQK